MCRSQRGCGPSLVPSDESLSAHLGEIHGFASFARAPESLSQADSRLSSHDSRLERSDNQPLSGDRFLGRKGKRIWRSLFVGSLKA